MLSRLTSYLPAASPAPETLVPFGSESERIRISRALLGVAQVVNLRTVSVIEAGSPAAALPTPTQAVSFYVKRDDAPDAPLALCCVVESGETLYKFAASDNALHRAFAAVISNMRVGQRLRAEVRVRGEEARTYMFALVAVGAEQRRV